MNWDLAFLALFDRSLALYRTGDENLDHYYTPEDSTFLTSIGCQPREFFDFVEDFGNSQDPAPPTALLVAAVRRDYFLTIQRGQFSDAPRLTRPGAPPFEESLEGFVYLPRLLAKARAKLRGELDPDLMYGCGADRRFFRQHGIHPADFLRHVWAAGEVDAKVVDWLRSVSCPNPS